jgi:hypothetical protein
LTDIERAWINVIGQGVVKTVYSIVFQMTTRDWACGNWKKLILDALKITDRYTFYEGSNKKLSVRTGTV